MRLFPIFRIFLIVLAFCLIPGTGVQAQGGHYWTEQYGTRSILMSGSVIGGTEDLGAVFYNPGRLSQVENPAFLLSANIYQLETLTFKNALDEGKDLKKKSWRGVPGLAAGTFKIGFMPKHHFAYAFLTRQRMNYSFVTRAELKVQSPCLLKPPLRADVKGISCFLARSHCRNCLQIK